MSGTGLSLPAAASGVSDEAVAFAAELIDRSGIAGQAEAALARPTGRRRALPVRAVLTALLCLALDDRPLHLTEATRVLFCRISDASRGLLGVTGAISGRRGFLAAYRRVRYCFHAILSIADPSPLPKNRRLTPGQLAAASRKMTPEQASAARDRLEALINSLVEASVSVLDDTERAACDGSAGLDATAVRCSPAARPSAAGWLPATPTAAGTSARATIANPRTTRARPSGKSPGHWRPPSPPWHARPAPGPAARTWPPAWPWPGPARTPAAPAPASWPPSPPAATRPAGSASTAPTPPPCPPGSTCPPARWATHQSWTTAPTSSASRPAPAAPSSSRAPGTAPPSPSPSSLLPPACAATPSTSTPTRPRSPPGPPTSSSTKTAPTPTATSGCPAPPPACTPG